MCSPLPLFFCLRMEREDSVCLWAIPPSPQLPSTLNKLWGRKGEAKRRGSQTQKCHHCLLAANCCNLFVFCVANILDLTFPWCIRITDTSSRHAGASQLHVENPAQARLHLAAFLVSVSIIYPTGHSPLTLQVTLLERTSKLAQAHLFVLE